MSTKASISVDDLMRLGKGTSLTASVVEEWVSTTRE